MPTSDPMPVFVIQAKDALAPEAVAAYAALCRRYRLDRQAVEVDKALAEIVAWQQRNDDQLRLPTHQHVHATRTAMGG